MSRLTALAAVLILATVAPAQDRTHAVTPADYASVATITELAVSPDGKRVAYCEARWDTGDDLRKTELWVVATDGKGKPRRITFDRANERHPKWSADGSAVFVLANRKRAAETAPPYDGKPQVWRVPADGGEPRAVTKVPGGVAGYDLAPKADAVFYAVDATSTDDDAFAKLRAKHKAEYGHGTRKVSEIHRLDLQTWRTDKVVDEMRYVREFAATPDGKRLAMITATDDSVIRSEGGSRVDVWDAASDKVTPTDDGWRKTAASPWPWLESLSWSPDGTKLAFCTIFDGYPAEVVIDELRKEAWVSGRVKRGSGVQVLGYGTRLKWCGDNGMWFQGEKSGRVTLVLLSSWYTENGKFYMGRPPGSDNRHLTEWTRANEAGVMGLIEDPKVASDGTKDFADTPDDGPNLSVVQMDRGSNEGYVTLRAKTTAFPNLFDEPRNHGDVPRRLTELNAQTKTWNLPSVRHITWKSPDGSTVGGILELPPGYKNGDKLPLIVAIHGGPTTSAKAELTFDPHNGRMYLSARGYAVLCPNYRGSTGYGDKFVTDLIGNENDLDVKDVLAGVQHLVKEGIADPERIGVMGWSNGGYLTNCLIALKDPPLKFKAASSGADILDTVAEWGFNDEPAYPAVFKKGLPWETPDAYRRTSPTYGLGNVTTPTLIHVGENDVRCPPGHSWMLYRALKEYRKVPAELVVYPGEPHGLTKLSNRTAKMEWDIAWFDKYLLGK